MGQQSEVFRSRLIASRLVECVGSTIPNELAHQFLQDPYAVMNVGQVVSVREGELIPKNVLLDTVGIDEHGRPYGMTTDRHPWYEGEIITAIEFADPAEKPFRMGSPPYFVDKDGRVWDPTAVDQREMFLVNPKHAVFRGFPAGRGLLVLDDDGEFVSAGIFRRPIVAAVPTSTGWCVMEDNGMVCMTEGDNISRLHLSNYSGCEIVAADCRGPITVVAYSASHSADREHKVTIRMHGEDSDVIPFGPFASVSDVFIRKDGAVVFMANGALKMWKDDTFTSHDVGDRRPFRSWRGDVWIPTELGWMAENGVEIMANECLVGDFVITTTEDGEIVLATFDATSGERELCCTSTGTLLSATLAVNNDVQNLRLLTRTKLNIVTLQCVTFSQAFVSRRDRSITPLPATVEQIDTDCVLEYDTGKLALVAAIKGRGCIVVHGAVIAGTACDAVHGFELETAGRLTWLARLGREIRRFRMRLF